MRPTDQRRNCWVTPRSARFTATVPAMRYFDRRGEEDRDDGARHQRFGEFDVVSQGLGGHHAEDRADDDEVAVESASDVDRAFPEFLLAGHRCVSVQRGVPSLLRTE